MSGKATLPQLTDQMLETLIPGPVTKEQFEDIFHMFKKAFIESAMGAEMSQHLGYGVGQAKPEGATNHSNGSSAKTVITDSGVVRIEVPRDCAGIKPIYTAPSAEATLAELDAFESIELVQ